VKTPPIFSYFDEPKSKGKKRESEPDELSLIFGIGKKELSYKRRRGLILRAIRGESFRKPKVKHKLGILTKIKKTKDKVKQEPRYYFELHKVIRRRRT